MVNRRQLRGYALFAVVFLLGAAAGGAVSFAIVQHHHAAIFREGRVLDERRLEALTRHLELDREQHTQVAAILCKSHDEIHAITKTMVATCGRPFLDYMSKVEAQIRELLRPEQRARFETLLREHRDMMGLPAPDAVASDASKSP